MEGALASDAPRFAASMMPGPPPVVMTLSRMPPRDMSAPPRSDAIRPKRRAWNRQEENRDRARGGGMHRSLFARYYRLCTFGSSCKNTKPACRLIEDGSGNNCRVSPHLRCQLWKYV